MRALALCSALNLRTNWDSLNTIVNAKRNFTKQQCDDELNNLLTSLRPPTAVVIKQTMPTKFTADPRLANSFNLANSKEKLMATNAVEKASVLLSNAWQGLKLARTNQDNYEYYCESFMA